MFKFIHTADIHLDSPLHRLAHYEGAPVEEVRQASRRAFENLIDHALGESVDFVLIAGDLFDGDWKDYNTGLYFVSQMQRLGAANIRVFIVSGNHDAAGRMTRTLPYPDNVHVLDHRRPQTCTLDRLQVAVHGQSFAKTAVVENLVQRYPEPVPGWFNIGLLHTSLTGREGHENYAPCALADLESRSYDYWALGHVHQFEQVAQTPPVIFPGCIQGRSVRETGEKGSVLVTVEDGRVTALTRCPHDVVRWAQVTVDLEGVETLTAANDRLKATLEALVADSPPLPVVARVTFRGPTAVHTDINGDVEYWTQAVRSAAVSAFGERVWIEKVKIQTLPPPASSTTAADPGPLHEMNRLVDELVASDTELIALGEILAPLWRKLPADYRRGDDALDPQDPERWRALVRQARDLLIRGLKTDRPRP
ncbi:MAG: DNA repair exonuclease [Desulfobacterales bacterium]|nr:DNA repair exonuclease [Desulfobacterales bacterium]